MEKDVKSVVITWNLVTIMNFNGGPRILQIFFSYSSRRILAFMVK